jgi:ComF family protein
MSIIATGARRIGNAALDFIFPPRCARCGASGPFLCGGCAGKLTPASPPRCDRCWRPRVSGLCATCEATPPQFDSLRTAFVYDGVARDLVHALKYRGLSALAEPMASLMLDAASEALGPIDIVVPVPLAGLRRRTRGYNQAEALARVLGRELRLPLEPRALVRKRRAPPQARSADAEARRRNVAGAFTARAQLAAGARVLLVDDVTTTGATFAACAAALMQAGAASVHCLAFARED